MSCKPRFICHFGRLSGPSHLVGCIFSHRGTPGLRVGPREDHLSVVLILLGGLPGFRAESGKNACLHVSCSVQVTLAVISAADAMVGMYSLKVNEFNGGIFFLLFNPWCAGNSGVQLCCGVSPPPTPTRRPHRHSQECPCLPPVPSPGTDVCSQGPLRLADQHDPGTVAACLEDPLETKLTNTCLSCHFSAS